MITLHRLATLALLAGLLVVAIAAHAEAGCDDDPCESPLDAQPFVCQPEIARYRADLKRSRRDLLHRAQQIVTLCEKRGDHWCDPATTEEIAWTLHGIEVVLAGGDWPDRHPMERYPGPPHFWPLFEYVGCWWCRDDP